MALGLRTPTLRKARRVGHPHSGCAECQRSTGCGAVRIADSHPSKSAKGGAPTLGLCGTPTPFEKREGWGTTFRVVRNDGESPPGWASIRLGFFRSCGRGSLGSRRVQLFCQLLESIGRPAPSQLIDVIEQLD